MYCSNCGTKNESKNNFCFNCGNALENIKKNEIKSGNNETSLILGIICFVSSFIVNIFCFIPGIISIIYAKKYKKESGKLGVGFGLSLGGMIISIVILFLCILFFIFIFNVASESANDYNGYNYNIKTEFTEGLPNV